MFLLGLVIGTIFGVLIISLCRAARSDDNGNN
jgi:hypothetical protein